MTPRISIQRDDFDPDSIVAALTEGRSDVGAVTTFLGLCRDEGGTLSALELEHYPGMAEEEIARIAAEAGERWPILGLTVVHRFGLIRPGERIVIVAAASSHRKAAFGAADFVMDFLKTSAPFWKREHRADGATGDWVAATEQDARAARAWGSEDDR